MCPLKNEPWWMKQSRLLEPMLNHSSVPPFPPKPFTSSTWFYQAAEHLRWADALQVVAGNIDVSDVTFSSLHPSREIMIKRQWSIRAFLSFLVFLGENKHIKYFLMSWKCTQMHIYITHSEHCGVIAFSHNELRASRLLNDKAPASHCPMGKAEFMITAWVAVYLCPPENYERIFYYQCLYSKCTSCIKTWLCSFFQVSF